METQPNRFCIECGEDITLDHANAKRCLDCRRAVNLGNVSGTTPRTGAARIVQIAIRSGMLPRLSDSDIECVDCGNPAQAYDHRDYMKPLDVDPVCFRCNSKRGSAINALLQSQIDEVMEKKGYILEQVYEQMATHDGKFSLPLPGSVLMELINGNSARDDEDYSDMENPRRCNVRMTIEVKYFD